MGTGNGKADDNTAAFPPVSELGAFHAAVNDIRDSVGSDHDNAPVALLCLVVRPDGLDRFVIGAEEYGITLIGSLELAKADLVNDMLCGQ